MLNPRTELHQYPRLMRLADLAELLQLFDEERRPNLDAARKHLRKWPQVRARAFGRIVRLDRDKLFQEMGLAPAPPSAPGELKLVKSR